MYLFQDVATLDGVFSGVMVAATLIVAASLLNQVIKAKIDWSVHFIGMVIFVQRHVKPSRIIVAHLAVVALCLVMGMTISAGIWAVSLAFNLTLMYISLYNPLKVCTKVHARAVDIVGAENIQRFYKA